jgi:hypothetical protein
MIATHELKQGDLELLEAPVARGLLQSRLPARLAYIARDGAPRLIPLLFHWTGEAIVFITWPDDPKVAALWEHPQVAVTIDTNDPPFHVLSLRGTAEVTIVDGIAPEAESMFARYHGAEEGRAWVARMGRMCEQMARIAVRPSWVGLLDFETRFPRGTAKRMGMPPV